MSSSAAGDGSTAGKGEVPTSRRAAAAGLAALALAVAGCGRKGPKQVAEVIIVPRDHLIEEPSDSAWADVPVHVAPLILQDMVEPRLLVPSTSQVRVQAMSDGARAAFRLQWLDSTKDDLPAAARFSDACAVQMPVEIAPDVPAPQMGEPGRPVEIVLWRASWQATVDGRGDTIKDLQPNATVDHYPFQAAPLTPGSEVQRAMEKRYAPARALGNSMAGPREKPVQDLRAEGPGTLSPMTTGDSTGRGERDPQGWVVVISRRLPPGLRPGERWQVALAVWEGGRHEVGARKMRTGWIPLLRETRP